MPIYRFKGYREDGSEATGTVEAEGARDAASKVREMGLHPKALRLEGKRLFRRADPSVLPLLTRQLSTLLGTGVPLLDALKGVSEETTGGWKAVLVGLRERVSQGSAFSRAMDEYPEVFPEFYRNMVAAGEAGGTLPAALTGLSDFLEKQNDIRARARSAMIYPVIMASVSVIVLSFIFAFVIPKIVRIFEDTKSALPLATVILIFLSNLFVRYWWLLSGLLLALAFGARTVMKRRRRTADRLLLMLPGGIVQSLYFSRFTRTLGLLLDGGVPMLHALALSGKAVGNSVLAEEVKKSEIRVAEGARLSQSLEGFPPMLLQLISTGEKGGRLVEVLGKAADAYEEEFRRRVDRAFSLLEPAMILLMAGVVGFIVFAVLLPIFELNQLIK